MFILKVVCLHLHDHDDDDDDGDDSNDVDDSDSDSDDDDHDADDDDDGDDSNDVDDSDSDSDDDADDPAAAAAAADDDDDDDANPSVFDRMLKVVFDARKTIMMIMVLNDEDLRASVAPLIIKVQKRDSASPFPQAQPKSYRSFVHIKALAGV